MKFKCVTSRDASQALVDALDMLRYRLEREIAYDCFGIPTGSMGPAELYVQETDFARGCAPFVSYNLSGITWKEGRRFDDALKHLENIVIELIRTHWRNAGYVQIMVVIATSTEDGTKSKLFETKSVYVHSGTGERREKID